MADVSLSPSIFPKQANPFRQLSVVCRQCSPITQRAKVLRRVKAKGTKVSPDASLKTINGGPMGLGTVFDNIHSIAPSNVHDRRHISRLPVEVNGNNSFKTTPGSWLRTCLML